ncbi:MAG TPA: CcdB family protein [Candidatus Saccharimonadales bacterium]|nr:CcdB family protein [Candidatus Saccharimonadales bacterium]
MQHEVFANPAPRTRGAFPFLTVLQADLAETGANRIVAPMAPRAAMPGAAGRLLPVVRHDGRDFLLAVELMTAVPRTALRHPLGSVAAHRDAITAALDWLFTGV